MADLPRLLARTFAAGKDFKGKDFLPAAVHRLDVPVSGCTLFARTPEALVLLNAEFHGASEAALRGAKAAVVEKMYWAIVELPPPGVSLPESGKWVHWIKAGIHTSAAGIHTNTAGTGENKSAAYDEEGPGRKRGALRYRILGQGDHYLFLEINLLTGRHHQIRAQLARMGLHIKGDLKYGARRSERGGGIRLHGYSLSFPAPGGAGTGEIIHVQALPPVPDPLWDAFEAAHKAAVRS
jgi:23S rRNA pseudouridine1911/1915/1917 synthase